MINDLEKFGHAETFSAPQCAQRNGRMCGWDHILLTGMGKGFKYTVGPEIYDVNICFHQLYTVRYKVPQQRQDCRQVVREALTSVNLTWNDP